DDRGSGVANQVHHLADYFPGAHYVVYENAIDASRIQILPEIVFAAFLLGPENLIGVQCLSDTERDRNTSGSRRNYCAVWERRHDLGLRSQQSRQRHVQYARIAVVAHCKRHLKVVTRMQSGWKLEMAFAKCARLTKQRVDLFLCG